MANVVIPEHQVIATPTLTPPWMMLGGWPTSWGPQATLPLGDRCGGRKPWGMKRGKADCPARHPRPGRRRCRGAHRTSCEPPGDRPSRCLPVTWNSLVALVAASGQPRRTIVTWLILPVVICLSQRLSHACLSISNYTAKLRMAHYISYRLFDSTFLHG
jgi:hypothetical protein